MTHTHQRFTAALVMAALCAALSLSGCGDDADGGEPSSERDENHESVGLVCEGPVQSFQVGLSLSGDAGEAGHGLVTAVQMGVGCASVIPDSTFASVPTEDQETVTGLVGDGALQEGDEAAALLTAVVGERDSDLSVTEGFDDPGDEWVLIKASGVTLSACPPNHPEC